MLTGTNSLTPVTSTHPPAELRTPLNAATLGLNMVVSELQQAGDPAQADLLETLSDVQQACSTAVDILNGERGEE